MYIPIPSFSLNTNSLSLFNRYFDDEKGTSVEDKRAAAKSKRENLKNIYGDNYESNKRFHNFVLSESSHKSIMQKINWLYFMAKSKHVKMLNGKEMFNFKINFITLTLPAKQVHPTSVITSKCLNQFLVEMKKLYNFENFVWRLEFQKNGNVHYHIVTDVYTDYYIVLKHWNRIINKLGYVSAYADKHKVMELTDYVKAYSNNGEVPFDTLKQRFIKGKAFKWQVPNSVDVKAVTSGKAVGLYIAKYFSKKNKPQCKCNDLDNIFNSEGLRLWYCSRSLSKLKKITDFVPAFNIDLLGLVTACKKTFKVVHDYCTSYFFDLKNMLHSSRAILEKLLRDYAFNLKYKPC